MSWQQAMMDEFLKYYERELTFAREMAAGFARSHPKVAARLQLEPDKCEDPHMERLIETFAFECARLHLKIDDHFPEIAEPLLNTVFPHFIRPIPSMAIVRFEPDTATVPPTGYDIAKGTSLFANPVDGINCQFSTVYPMTLWPVQVAAASLREPRRLVKDAKRAIVIQMKTCNGLSLDEINWETLRFFIDASGGDAFHIHELIANNACHVECVLSNAQGDTETVGLSPAHILPVGYEPDEAMLPSLRGEFPGFLLLFEYFSFPEKFLFVDITGLDRCRRRGMDTIELWIYLDREPRQDVAIGSDTFGINCTPVVNLFRHISASMNVEQHKCEYRLDPGDNPDAGEIYDIAKVVGTTTGSSDVELRPLYSLRHHRQDDDASGKVFWRVQRRPSGRKGDKGTDVFISFSDQALKQVQPAVEQLIFHTDCMNRDLPVRLQYGDPSGELTLDGTGPIKRINFTQKPVPTRRPTLEGILQWQALSSLKPNYLPLMRGQEEAFKSILRLYDFDNSPVTRRLIDGIRTVQSRHVTRRIGQGFFRGVEVTIEFEESDYAESGMFMFASVLERYLIQFVSSNSFMQLVSRTLPGGRVFKTWEPRRGVRALL